MKPWMILVAAVVLVGGAWKACDTVRTRRSAKAQVALAEVLCESDLFDEAAEFADGAIKGSIGKTEGREKLSALMARFDEALEAKEVSPKDTSAFGEGTLGSSASPLLDRFHELCPDRHNADPKKAQKVVGLVFGFYVMRSKGNAP